MPVSLEAGEGIPCRPTLLVSHISCVISPTSSSAALYFASAAFLFPH